MTPAIKLLKQNKINYTLHKYQHNTQNLAYANEAVELLKIESTLIYKTLVVSLANGKLAIAIISASSMLSMKQMAKVLAVKKVTMAKALEVEKSTGYILGAVSPIGQKTKLETIIDIASMEHKTIYISGGQRGLEIEINPSDLQTITNAKIYDIQQG